MTRQLQLQLQLQLSLIRVAVKSIEVARKSKAQVDDQRLAVSEKRTIDDSEKPSEAFVELRGCAVVRFGGHSKAIVIKAASRVPWLTATTTAAPGWNRC